ncbi:MAG: hypothetical protein ACI35R_11790 [Bacillus sp. (in: firmicutes)]
MQNIKTIVIMYHSPIRFSINILFPKKFLLFEERLIPLPVSWRYFNGKVFIADILIEYIGDPFFNSLYIFRMVPAKD